MHVCMRTYIHQYTLLPSYVCQLHVQTAATVHKDIFVNLLVHVCVHISVWCCTVALFRCCRVCGQVMDLMLVSRCQTRSARCIQACPPAGMQAFVQASCFMDIRVCPWGILGMYACWQLAPEGLTKFMSHVSDAQPRMHKFVGRVVKRHCSQAKTGDSLQQLESHYYHHTDDTDLEATGPKIRLLACPLVECRQQRGPKHAIARIMPTTKALKYVQFCVQPRLSGAILLRPPVFATGEC